MTPAEALSLGMFAINTVLAPDASSDEDVARLDASGHEAVEILAQLRDSALGLERALPDPVAWRVCDNVTGYPVGIKTYDKREYAESTCAALNLQAGPGGRYGVEIRENGEWRRDDHWLEGI